MTILDKLNLVAKTVYNEVPTVNYGGCCVYAAKVGKELQRLGYEVRVVFRDIGEYTENNPKIKCPEKAEDQLGVDFYHIGLAVKVRGKWYTHDAEKTHKGLRVFGDECLPVAKTYLTVEQAESFAKKRHFWNNVYPRRRGGKIIAHAINKHLKG